MSEMQVDQAIVNDWMRDPAAMLRRCIAAGIEAGQNHSLLDDTFAAISENHPQVIAAVRYAVEYAAWSAQDRAALPIQSIEQLVASAVWGLLARAPWSAIWMLCLYTRPTAEAAKDLMDRAVAWMQFDPNELQWPFPSADTQCTRGALALQDQGSLHWEVDRDGVSTVTVQANAFDFASKMVEGMNDFDGVSASRSESRSVTMIVPLDQAERVANRIAAITHMFAEGRSASQN